MQYNELFQYKTLAVRPVNKRNIIDKNTSAATLLYVDEFNNLFLRRPYFDALYELKDMSGERLKMYVCLWTFGDHKHVAEVMSHEAAILPFDMILTYEDSFPLNRKDSYVVVDALGLNRADTHSTLVEDRPENTFRLSCKCRLSAEWRRYMIKGNEGVDD